MPVCIDKGHHLASIELLRSIYLVFTSFAIGWPKNHDQI